MRHPALYHGPVAGARHARVDPGFRKVIHRGSGSRDEGDAGEGVCHGRKLRKARAREDHADGGAQQHETHDPGLCQFQVVAPGGSLTSQGYVLHVKSACNRRLRSAARAATHIPSHSASHPVFQGTAPANRIHHAAGRQPMQRIP